MRDEERIDKFCDALKVYWHKVPDWRFMQLICNYQQFICSDGFYREEDKVLEDLNAMFNMESK